MRIPSHVSHGFKVWILLYVCVVTGYRMVRTFYFPEVSIISDQVILGTVLFALAYIWFTEVRDRHILERTYLELLEAQEKQKQANINTIASLILSVEAKDLYTSGHSERVMQYSLAIAKRMPLSAANQAILRTACLLHDVGKIAIPDSILRKVEPLTAGEWDVIRKHPQEGFEILAPLDFLAKEKLLILHHHERYDGTGYPRGLKGEAIPEGARIMALADAYDAMKTKRSYREPLSDAAIYHEIMKNSGLQFDPKIVNVLLELIKEGFAV